MGRSLSIRVPSPNARKQDSFPGVTVVFMQNSNLQANISGFFLAESDQRGISKATNS